MVFVWSYLTNGDPNYTLVQVSVNDLIILVAFVPIRGFAFWGITNVEVPYDTLVSSVLILWLSRFWPANITNKSLIRRKVKHGSKTPYCLNLNPFSILALLLTLILLFAFQGNTITENPFIILLVAVPLIIQTYFIFFYHLVCGQKTQFASCNMFTLSHDWCKQLFRIGCCRGYCLIWFAISCGIGNRCRCAG